jgi:hypothetical protein
LSLDEHLFGVREAQLLIDICAFFYFA